MKRFLKRFFVQQSGASAVEYALIAALLTIALVAALGPLTTALTGAFQEAANAIPQSVP